MNKRDKVLLGVLSIMAFFCLTFMVDYLLPGAEKEEKVQGLASKAEAGTRMGGTSVSYKLRTASFSFYIDPFNFMEAKEGDRVKLEVSSIYNRVNSYQIVGKMESTTAPIIKSLTSLFLPLLTIGLCAIAYAVKRVPHVLWSGLVLGALTLIVFFI